MYCIVADDGDLCAEKRERLVQIPSERVKVIYEENVDGLSELNGKNERHVSRTRGRGGGGGGRRRRKEEFKETRV